MTRVRSAALPLLAVLTGCSDIPRDIDLAPVFRTARHPGSDLNDTDIAGPIVPPGPQ